MNNIVLNKNVKSSSLESVEAVGAAKVEIFRKWPSKSMELFHTVSRRSVHKECLQIKLALNLHFCFFKINIYQLIRLQPISKEMLNMRMKKVRVSSKSLSLLTYYCLSLSLILRHLRWELFCFLGNRTVQNVRQCGLKPGTIHYSQFVTENTIQRLFCHFST